MDKTAKSLSTSAYFLSAPESPQADKPFISLGKVLPRLATFLPSKQSVDGSNPSGGVSQIMGSQDFRAPFLSERRRLLPLCSHLRCSKCSESRKQGFVQHSRNGFNGFVVPAPRGDR